MAVREASTLLTRRAFLKAAGVAMGAVALGLNAVPAAAAPAARRVPYIGMPQVSGETITVFLHAGPFEVGHNLFKDRFESETGIKVNVVAAAPEAIFERTMTEFTGRTAAFDVVQFIPAWLSDFSRFLEPMEGLATKNGLDFKLDDIAPPFRDAYMKWDGVWYGVTWDGDVHIAHYYRPAFENTELQKQFMDRYGYELKPPEDWKQYVDVAKFFTDVDWVGDGQKRYGSAEYLKRGRMYWWYFTRFASMGLPYFDADLKPMITHEAAVAAAQNMLDALPGQPPGALNYSYVEVLQAMAQQQVAYLPMQWTSASKAFEDPKQSKVVGKIGYALVPGQRMGDKVNHRPLLAGGWELAVPRDSKHKDAAATYIWWYTKPEISLPLVMNPETGMDPYRISHFQSEEFAKAWPAAGEYLKAINDNIAVAYPDLLIPGAAEYNDVIDLELTDMLAGSKKPQEALENAARKWEEITERLGREGQLKYWTAQYNQMKASGLIMTT